MGVMLDTGEQYDADLSLMSEVIEANERQKKRVVNRLEETIGSFENRIATILGLSYKPMTRKVIESPAIAIINELILKALKFRFTILRQWIISRNDFPIFTITALLKMPAEVRISL